MRRCPLCHSSNFKRGGFADRCFECRRAFGPFGVVELGERPIWPAVLFFGIIAMGLLSL